MDVDVMIHVVKCRNDAFVRSLSPIPVKLRLSQQKFALIRCFIKEMLRIPVKDFIFLHFR